MTQVLELPEWKPFESSGTDPAETSVSILEALRSISIAQDPKPAIEASLVLSLPRIHFSEALATRDVVLDLIASARESVLVFAYELSDRDVIARLHEFQRGSGRILRILGNHGANIERLHTEWPLDARPDGVEFYEYIKREDQRFGSEQSPYYPVLHMKTIVADRKRCLIGSANFTAGGTRNNVEAGVRLESEAIAEQLWTFSERITSLPICRLC